MELFDNQLKILPVTIGNLLSLQTLILNGNPLTNLPVSIRNLKNLKRIGISRNYNLKTLPMSFSNLKALKYVDIRNTSIFSLKNRVKTRDFVLKNLKEIGSIEWMSEAIFRTAFIVGVGVWIGFVLLGYMLLILAALLNFENITLNIVKAIFILFGITHLIAIWLLYRLRYG
ncbi:MAG: hypothetical protein ACFFCM_08530 [Promethearchaeota archaeon]